MTRWKPSFTKDSCNGVRSGHASTSAREILAYLLVDVQLAEDLGGIQQVGVVDNPRPKSAFIPSPQWSQACDVLLDVVGKQRQVQDQRHPVAVNQEQERQESVDSGFGDDVGVEAVAEVNGVDVVAVGGEG